MSEKKAQVFLIFGFLGSGKTTLIRNIFSWDMDLSHTAVMVNEFGEVGIDGMILENGPVPVVELTNGCICCSMKTELVQSLREMINRVEKVESRLIHDNTHIYLRDVLDHTVRVIDIIETFREMVSNLTETYNSNVSNRMNEVMKVLTIIATLFIPLTFLAGIYGMNFKYMPELEWKWGYPSILVLMVIIIILMFAWFRRKRFW